MLPPRSAPACNPSCNNFGQNLVLQIGRLEFEMSWKCEGHHV